MRRDTPVRAAERELREVVNIPHVQDQLMKDRQIWGMLCASMDVIGDTDLAIDSFRRHPQVPRNDLGNLYLITYGLLQALILQQDAVVYLFESLGLKYNLPPDLKEIRDIRNSATGHPTKKRDKKSFATFGISRHTFTHEGFFLFCFDLNRSDLRREVKVAPLLESQEKYVLAAIREATEHIRRLE